MNITFNVIEALESLGSNKLRSMLTVLGIVIGVAAVISLLAVGNGATAAITSQIESIGTNLVFITPGSTNQGGVASAAGSANTLTTEDASALTQLPGVVAVAPLEENRVQIAYQGQNANTRLVGTTPPYQTMSNLTLASGSFFSDANESGYSSVVVLGSAVAQELFTSNQAAVGQLVTLNGQPFQVIGVLQSKGGSGFFNQDDQIFVPLSTAQLRLVGRSNFGQGNVVNSIDVQVDKPKDVTPVTNEINQTLAARHGSLDFTVTSQQDVLSAVTQTTNVLTIFLGGIAGISLLVGGIGIMNIMLTTVSERTREIGLRKAIGARRADILQQFLVESVVLSVLGGVIGIILGWLIAHILGHIQLGGTAITPVVSVNSILLATLFSMAVGLFFGIYPANRAAKLEPVEALRTE
ncbi:MAG: ABC transporter permease [Anaerolineales bacterium]|jgi:putative ABC transport system permease protein